MIRHIRSRGRHRAGEAVPMAVSRRRWDAAARQAAAELDRLHRHWTVLYGVRSRRFYALAAWPASEPIIVSAATAEELRAVMGTAELAASAQRRIAA